MVALANGSVSSVLDGVDGVDDDGLSAFWNILRTDVLLDGLLDVLPDVLNVSEERFIVMQVNRKLIRTRTLNRRTSPVTAI